MRRLFTPVLRLLPPLTLSLVAAAPLLLVSSPAMADSPCISACHFTADPSSCSVVLTGGCSAQCTPLSVQAQCDGSCTVSASAECTGSCQTSCEANCKVQGPSFQCVGSCNSECNASCATSCNTDDCKMDCEADCQNRCDVSCNATPGTADCSAQCQASCNGSCEVQANVDCQESCTVTAQGGCTASCAAPEGALFCSGQYVSFTDAADCLTCLEENGFTLTASTTCTAGAGCETDLGVGSTACAAAPALGSSKDRWGVFGIAGLMVGLGLVASRKRARA